MRYAESHRLRFDAKRVADGGAALWRGRESLDEQIQDTIILANRFGLYDAADWIKELVAHRKRYQADYGEEPPHGGL